MRRGPISVFTDGDGVIDEFDDLEEVWQVSGRAKVVREINYCGQQHTVGTILGCSAGVGMVVRRWTSSLEGVLWAHEYGHNKDLWLAISGGHESDTDRLGHALIHQSRRKVTQSECNLMRLNE